MSKILNGIHILAFSILVLSAVSDAVFLFIKFVSPSSDLVRFWRPGDSYITIPLRLIILTPILAYSTRLLKHLPFRSLVALVAVWLVCLTWMGWFSADAWFRRYDLDGVDWNDTSSVNRAILPQLAWHMVIYISIVGASIIPVVLHWRDARHNNNGCVA
jgi:hypothetical protein